MSAERQFVWARYRHATTDHGRQRLLIAARKAVGTPPGTAPEVWPLYTSSDDAGISAEHLTAGIWATHQQGGRDPVHLPKTEATVWPTNFGGACRRLFDEQFSGNPQIRSPIDTMAEDTITQRLAVLSRTDEVEIATAHVTSLVRLIRSTGKHVAFNYDDLYWAVRTWNEPEKRTATMHRWSRSYFHTSSRQTTEG